MAENARISCLELTTFGRRAGNSSPFSERLHLVAVRTPHTSIIESGLADMGCRMLAISLMLDCEPPILSICKELDHSGLLPDFSYFVPVTDFLLLLTNFLMRNFQR
jgi:hypothetical protein